MCIGGYIGGIAAHSPLPRPMKEQIEQALRQLPLDESEIPALAARVAASSLIFNENKALKPGSSSLDFRGNLGAVVGHFAAHGLRLPDYVQAAVRQPSLFLMSPATVI